MEFRVLNLVGVVYRHDDNSLHLVDEDHGDQKLEDELRAMTGGLVQAFLHHAPPEPHDPNRWGGGCCLWESSGKCPSGHHDRKGYLYEVTGTGQLVERGEKWFIERDSQSDLPIYLDMLEGHRCRVSVVPQVGDPKSVIENLKNDVDMNDLEGLKKRASDLQDFLAKVKDLEKGGA